MLANGDGAKRIWPTEFGWAVSGNPHPGYEYAADNTADEQAAWTCLLYTSDAADERSSVDLGGRRIIKKKKTHTHEDTTNINEHNTTVIASNRYNNTD